VKHLTIYWTSNIFYNTVLHKYTYNTMLLSPKTAKTTKYD